MREGYLTVAVVALLVGSLVGAGATLGAVAPTAPGTASPDERPGQTTTGGPASLQPSQASVERFGSQTAFTDYVERGRRHLNGGFATVSTARFTAGPNVDVAREAEATAAPERADGVELYAGDGSNAGGTAGGDDGSAPSRMGTTNVQVAGLDEPDRVKTDGTSTTRPSATADTGSSPNPILAETSRGPGRPSSATVPTRPTRTSSTRAIRPRPRRSVG